MTETTLDNVDILLEAHLPPYYEAVGRIAYAWSMLEHNIGDFNASLDRHLRQIKVVHGVEGVMDRFKQRHQ
jgi:hypothetical protein